MRGQHVRLSLGRSKLELHPFYLSFGLLLLRSVETVIALCRLIIYAKLETTNDGDGRPEREEENLTVEKI